MTLVIDLDNGETVFLESYKDLQSKTEWEKLHHDAKAMMKLGLEWIKGNTIQDRTIYIQVAHIVKIAEVD